MPAFTGESGKAYLIVLIAIIRHLFRLPAYFNIQ